MKCRRMEMHCAAAAQHTIERTSERRAQPTAPKCKNARRRNSAVSATAGHKQPLRTMVWVRVPD
eukprot:11185891-Lingulodinium_polyedra.AAC.1